MTVRNAGGDSRIQLVQLGEDMIAAAFKDGSAYYDADVTDERGEGLDPSVDFFIHPQGSDVPYRYVVRRGPDDDVEKFRRIARRWGSLRSEYANTEERSFAQQRFNLATTMARMALNEFSKALKQDRVRIQKMEPDGPLTLCYEDAKGGAWRPFRMTTAKGAEGEARRISGLLFEGDDNLRRVMVRNVATLAILREKLEEWQQRLDAANSKN